MDAQRVNLDGFAAPDPRLGLRARRTPSNQAHVTNRLDDPLLLAADAATAAAFGFREIETTVPVLADAPSNAVACLIGATVASAGVLIQCSVEEAAELELGMRGLTSYSETVSLYGTSRCSPTVTTPHGPRPSWPPPTPGGG
jgi:propanediol dehydratase large subunit